MVKLIPASVSSFASCNPYNNCNTAVSRSAAVRVEPSTKSTKALSSGVSLLIIISTPFFGAPDVSCVAVATELRGEKTIVVSFTYVKLVLAT